MKQSAGGTLIEFYSEIRFAHVAAVISSGALFLLRGIFAVTGRQAWALAPFPRYLSYGIDTTLLTAALMLLSILPWSVFANGWLAAKLALLPAYVGFGWLALRRPAGWQPGYLAGALLTYAAMFAIARAHSPLGPLNGWLGS